MKRKDLNLLLNTIKEELFLDNPDRRNNIINLLEGSRFEEINETTSSIVISTASTFSKDILNTSEFKEEFSNVAYNILNSNYKVVFVGREEWEKRNISETTNELKLMSVKSDSLRSDFTLDNFLSSENGENRMIKQASLAVTLKPGDWSPFFIYGGSGLGKTHLLHAIGNGIRSNYPNHNIRYLESKDFKDLIYTTGGINTSQINNVVNEFLSYDVLLIDDVQMLQSLPKAKEVFFSILSNFINEKKQIVITSDQYPEEMKDFEERFITRFKGGVVLSVTPPDIETSKLILKQKLKAKDMTGNIVLSDSALEFIATNFGSNVRELEGSLGKIIFWAIANNKDTTEFTVEDMIDIFDGLPNNRGLTIEHIVSVVGKNYQISTRNILGKTRVAEVVLCRHLAAYFCKTLLDITVMDIARYFGRNHSTILSSIKKIEKESATNQELSRVIYDLRKKIISN